MSDKSFRGIYDSPSLEDKIMVLQDLKDVRAKLERFVKRFDHCVKTRPSRRHLRTYLGGQVSDLPRKSVEPIALEAGVPPRTLQEFLGLHRWDHEAMRVRVQEIVMRDHADDNAVAVVDETGFPKKGDQTAGVQRQYCGATGKKDNCVISVHLGYAAGDFHTLIDGDLYLPETSWAQDPDRRQKAGIPDHVVYRPKWRIALELLERSIENGVRFKYLTADEAYGGCGAFRRRVAERGLCYVVEVPCSTSGWTRRPPVQGPDDYMGIGRRRTRETLAREAPAPRRVDRLWKRGGPSWEAFHIKDTDKGPVVWEVRATRFFPWQDDAPGDESWLLIARNVLDGEVKYFLSNAPAETSLETLLAVAFSRWRIERLFEDAKGQIGMDHFEVRRYLPIIRHLILSMVSLLFLATETGRLRKKKSSLEHPPGTVCARGAA